MSNDICIEPRCSATLKETDKRRFPESLCRKRQPAHFVRVSMRRRCESCFTRLYHNRYTFISYKWDEKPPGAVYTPAAFTVEIEGANTTRQFRIPTRNSRLNQTLQGVDLWFLDIINADDQRQWQVATRDLDNSNLKRTIGRARDMIWVKNQHDDGHVRTSNVYTLRQNQVHTNGTERAVPSEASQYCAWERQIATDCGKQIHVVPYYGR